MKKAIWFVYKWNVKLLLTFQNNWFVIQFCNVVWFAEWNVKLRLKFQTGLIIQLIVSLPWYLEENPTGEVITLSQSKQDKGKQRNDSATKKASVATSNTVEVKAEASPDASVTTEGSPKVKPFPCTQCKMRLTTAERLLKHIDIKHCRPKAGKPGFPVRRHLCTICGHGFRDINRFVI